MFQLPDKALYLAVRLSQTGPGTPGGGTGPGTPGGTGTTPGTGTIQVPEGLPEGGVLDIIQNVINFGLAVAGGVAMLLLVVGGFLYVTAAGDESRIEKAKKTIKGAIIGIIFILLSGIIVNTVTQALFFAGNN
jgi:hypothetical protein